MACQRRTRPTCINCRPLGTEVLNVSIGAVSRQSVIGANPACNSRSATNHSRRFQAIPTSPKAAVASVGLSACRGPGAGRLASDSRTDYGRPRSGGYVLRTLDEIAAISWVVPRHQAREPSRVPVGRCCRRRRARKSSGDEALLYLPHRNKLV